MTYEEHIAQADVDLQCADALAPSLGAQQSVSAFSYRATAHIAFARELREMREASL